MGQRMRRLEERSKKNTDCKNAEKSLGLHKQSITMEEWEEYFRHISKRRQRDDWRRNRQLLSIYISDGVYGCAERLRWKGNWEIDERKSSLQPGSWKEGIVIPIYKKRQEELKRLPRNNFSQHVV